MSLEPPRAELRPSDPEAKTQFRDWLRRYVTEAAQLRAFDAGEIDAVLDPTSGQAILLPPAQAAVQRLSSLVLSALEALPGEVCVLDSAGTVITTNKAWRAFAAAHSGAGLGVPNGVDFFAACRDARDGERAHAASVAAGLRLVLGGTCERFSCEYACRSSRGKCSFTLTITAFAGNSSVHAVLTRENVSEGVRTRAVSRAEHAPVHTHPRKRAATAQRDCPNRLLAALSVSEHKRLRDGLDLVTLTYGEVLNEPGEPMRYVYFPNDCLVSLLTVVEGHHALEVGLIGREGMVGSRLALGVGTSPVRALVQGSGTALRMKSTRFLQELRRCPVLRQATLHFADSLMGQVTHTAACNRFHVVEARLARWLLMTRERLSSAQFRLTQEFLADMLGVRRVGVTAAARALQHRKLIHYRRGIITILDQKALEAACCSCYRHVQIPGLDAAS